MAVIGTVFKRRGELGDFDWMIRQPEYNDSLFIYSDNIECFSSHSQKRGAGNAIIRPYRFSVPPRSSPIVTGSFAHGGFSELTDSVKWVIDSGVEEIKIKIKENDYKRVYYSAEVPNGMLGQKLFVIHLDVRTYITKCLHCIFN